MSGLQRSQSIAADLDLRPLAGRIGAHIDNIHLAGDLPDAVIAAIGAVLWKYKVIFFRNQGHLDDAEQERLGRGSAISSPMQPGPHFASRRRITCNSCRRFAFVLG
jgi:alpha-ketoglutarate-dependent taurine dioxygenase